MDTQTDTIVTSSDAATQTIISVSPNHLQVDVAIQCVIIDDKFFEEQGSQTEVSINPNVFPVDSSIQCNMLDETEVPNKENVLPDIVCKGNDDEKFYPLVQKHRGTFKDLSGM